MGIRSSKQKLSSATPPATSAPQKEETAATGSPKKRPKFKMTEPTSDSTTFNLNDYPSFMPFASRRSVVHSANGIVACSQPLAAQAGLKILREGGNAADAAVAVAAALNVTEPTSTGIGGDMFCLFYSASEKRVIGINGSGRSPAALTLEKAKADINDPKATRIPMTHVHSVSVPGAAAGWCDVVEKLGSGKFKIGDVLQEAIRLAEEGYPVSQLSAGFWARGEKQLRNASPNYGEMLKTVAGGKKRAPRNGEIMRMPQLASTFRALAAEGKPGYYTGRVAEAIIEVTKSLGGVMELEDLENHMEVGSQEVEPISMDFAGHRVWECAPNGQGMIALMALGIIEALQDRGVVGKLGVDEGWEHNSAKYLHVVVEALRIAFADGHWWIADPDVEKVPVEGLLDKKYLHERSKLFDPNKTIQSITHGTPAFQSSDTVYFSVTDAFGNGCSFINSNFGGFGTAIIPAGCGFTLQNRASGFSLLSDHPNRLAPNKRPYHTIIPGLLTTIPTPSTPPELKAVFGVMGGFMQPQGHVQVVLNLLHNGMDAQTALDAPRVSIGASYDPGAEGVNVEEGVAEEDLEGLKRMGHIVKSAVGYERSMFGRGQVIMMGVDAEDDGRRVYSAGSDLRADGCAVGY